MYLPCAFSINEVNVIVYIILYQLEKDRKGTTIKCNLMTKWLIYFNYV